ncbi:MAG: 50S ribosomal protein L10, partial [bacterium]
MVNPRKVEWVEELEDEIEESANLIFTGFRGLTVEKMENLRRQLYDCDTTYRVVKNRLARRAFLQENVGEETSDESSATERKEEASEAELTDLPGVGPATAEDFQAAGFNSVVDVASSAEEELQQIQGVGPSRAGEMLEEAKKISGPRKDSEEQKSSNGEVPEEINEFLSGNTAIAFNRKG